MISPPILRLSMFSLLFFIFLASAFALTIDAGSDGVTLIAAGEDWDYFKGVVDPHRSWKDVGFVPEPDSWASGPSGFGYSDGDDATVLGDMEGGYSSLFIRKEFVVDVLPEAIPLELVVDYDDGFVAWLNGVEVARSENIPVGVPDFQTTTIRGENREAGEPDVIRLGMANDLLVAGANVLAVAGFNASLDSSDFSLVPRLQTGSDITRNGDVLIVETPTVSLHGSVDSVDATAVAVNRKPVVFDVDTRTWLGEAVLVPGRNTVVVEAVNAEETVLESDSVEVIYVSDDAHVSGAVDVDSVWSDVRLLEGVVEVPEGVVLRIEPGTMVLMKPGASMEVEGALLAEGTEESPIVFTHYGNDTTWKNLLFVQAEDSCLRHCVIEYSDCEGDHKDYYDDDCDDRMPPPGGRDYFQAVVALGCFLEIDGCLFHRLPDDGDNAEGDAVAIISDDPDLPPAEASASIHDCRFIGIGQGVHTRFAHVKVENCFFTGHNGDNDDIDLYGESSPPPLIIGNTLIDPGHDDMINPTRCSAIIVGNVVAGSDDHGIVLRDKCRPVLINNIIYNCSAAAVSVQNQCDALLINNTIVDCGRGVRFFDHTSRRDPPYCLFPGSGSATVINCIIRDCPRPFDLEDSPYPDDRGSHVVVEYSNVEGGQEASLVSANSTMTWGAGNIDGDPGFVDESQEVFQLTSGSVCIDAGRVVSELPDDLAGYLSGGYYGVPRGLDGDGDSMTGVDMGAAEFLLATADSNGDGVPDGWYHRYDFDPTAPGLAAGDPDGDSQSTGEEWLSDTDPGDAGSFFYLTDVSLTEGGGSVAFRSSADRLYTLSRSRDLRSWNVVSGQENVPGSGGVDMLVDVEANGRSFYRVSVRKGN